MNAELERLRMTLGDLESSIVTHPMVATSSITVFEQVSLKRAQDAGVDINQIPDFDARLKKAKELAPIAELEDATRRAEEY